MRAQFVIPVLVSVLILGTFSFVIPPAQTLSTLYNFNILAQPGDIIDSKTLTGIGTHSLNNKGDIVFRGDFSGGSGIFTPTSLIAGTGDVIDGKTLTFAFQPSLNKKGDIVFVGDFSGDRGIFTPTSLIASTGDVIGGKTLFRVDAPSMNNKGEIVFLGLFTDGTFALILASQHVDDDDD